MEGRLKGSGRLTVSDPRRRPVIPAKEKKFRGNVSTNSRVSLVKEDRPPGPRDGDYLQDRNRLARFERTVTPHLEAAYNLARWLTRNDQDAEDIVQEACMRAFRSLDGFLGTDGRPWLLTIVRNTSYTWLHRNRRQELTIPLDDRLLNVADDSPGPEAAVLRNADRQALSAALDDLPVEFREVIVLREMEDLSYREIAEIADIPIGTVMSRLARARKRLQESLARGAAVGAKELRREL
jgi:RNA polymerase sigma-70 factor (ECF subfamily)